MPLIVAVMMGGSIVHPCWVSSGCRAACFVNFMEVALVRNVITMCEFIYLHFGVGEKGGLAIQDAPNMHSLYGT